MTSSATPSGDPLALLRRQLRAHLRSGQDQMTLTAAQMRVLGDDLARLQQSNDRLRRQNRRLRSKLQAATGEVEPGDDRVPAPGQTADPGDGGGDS